MIYGVNAVLDENVARQQHCVPIKYVGSDLAVAYDCDHSDIEYVEGFLKEKGVKGISFLPYASSEIFRLINMYYSIELKDRAIFTKLRDYIHKNQLEPLFNEITAYAKKFGASDIHLFQEGVYCVIRFRIKGRLKTFCILDSEMASALGRIIKVKGNVDISKSLKPLDTRMIFESDGETMDIRVSIVKTMEGEKFSLRLLNNENVPRTLNDLGLSREKLSCIRRAISKESGAILVSGPTGSGKSTTVRCFIHEINNGNQHIVSIEDPIEYKMPGVTQIQVADRDGSRFSDGVRAVLRQDPDILFIGEIRDEVSAEVAMKASMTGHLVFSTLHTRSAALAVERLENLGVDTHLIFGSVAMIINQRLVGEQCEHCKKEIIYYGEDIPTLNLKNKERIFESEGCVHCDYSGIKKRIPVMSILEINDGVRKEYAMQGTLHEENSVQKEIAEKFSKGEISLEEARRFI